MERRRGNHLIIGAQRPAAPVKVRPQCGVHARDLLIVGYDGQKIDQGLEPAFGADAIHAGGHARDASPKLVGRDRRHYDFLIVARFAEVEVAALGGNQHARVEDEAHALAAPAAAAGEAGRRRRAPGACGSGLRFDRDERHLGCARTARDKRAELGGRDSAAGRHELGDGLAVALDHVGGPRFAHLIHERAEATHGVGGGDGLTALSGHIHIIRIMRITPRRGLIYSQFETTFASMSRDARGLLPLKPVVFEILLVLAEGDRHGWNLVRALERRTGQARLLPGNFYRVLKGMLSEGLIEAAEPSRAMRAQAAADTGANADRRQYFRLTRFGRDVARAEARRLEALVVESRDKRLIEAKGR